MAKKNKFSINIFKNKKDLLIYLYFLLYQINI